MGEIVRRRVGFDFDDVLVGRQFAARFGGAVKGLFFHNIPELDHKKFPYMDPIPSYVGGYDGASLWFHERRKAIPGAIKRLEEEAKNSELLIACDRLAVVDWSEATYRQIDREKIPVPKKNVIFTPRGESAIVSIAHAIMHWKIDEYTTSSLQTVSALARCFPDKRFNWIRYGLTDIPVDEHLVASMPNVRQIPISRWKQGKN